MPKKKAKPSNQPIFDWIAFSEEQDRKNRSKPSPKRQPREDAIQAAFRVVAQLTRDK
jgi:hypothetical protein